MIIKDKTFDEKTKLCQKKGIKELLDFCTLF